MRDKIVKLMSLIMVPFDQTIDALVEQLTEQFQIGFGPAGIPPDATEALTVVGAAARARRGVIEDQVIAIYEKHLGEADLDALIAFYDSDAYKKLSAASPALQHEIADATSVWIKQTMESVEGDLQRLLGASPAPVEAPAPTDAPTAA